MPSFQITLTPKDRAAGRFVGRVKRAFQKALDDERRRSGLTQSKMARSLDVHRSVLSREINGNRGLSATRIGELAWAMGLEPHFELRKPTVRAGQNSVTSAPAGTDIGTTTTPAQSGADVNAMLRRPPVPVAA
ncbi:MAG TPA: helix-turn-helix transcriptional regulator [Caulobacteraceae bacterium]|nr:helix-turn-helix transcriptional regulator [Caulobacteraceae bacterium]